MGTTLTGTTPQDTYDSLIKVTDNGPLSGTAKYLSDGLGNDSVLALSTAQVGVGVIPAANVGNLQVGGAANASIFSQQGTDTVRAGVRASGRVGIVFDSSDATYTNRMWYLDSVGANGTLTIGRQGLDVMTFANAGNVGIGTSAPSAMLTLKSTSPFIRIERDGVPHWQIQNNTLVNDAGFSINNATNVATPFFINGTTNQVGILNANPLQPLDVTGNIRTSTGILFGSDTAAANLLDDYEEGTWTMGVSFGGGTTGVTYVSNTGTYTKIGRQVTLCGFLRLSSKGSSTGQAAITGLPFSVFNSQPFLCAVSLRLNEVSFANQFQAYVDISSGNIFIQELTEAGVLSNLDVSNFTNDSQVILNVTYFV